MRRYCDHSRIINYLKSMIDACHSNFFPTLYQCCVIDYVPRITVRYEMKHMLRYCRICQIELRWKEVSAQNADRTTNFSAHPQEKDVQVSAMSEWLCRQATVHHLGRSFLAPYLHCSLRALQRFRNRYLQKQYFYQYSLDIRRG